MDSISQASRILGTATALALLLTAHAIADRRADRLVIFGDSLSDPGNFFVETGEFVQAPYEPVPDAPYAIGGFHFSNGNTWVERLATDLHVPTSAGPATRVPGLFTNYAFGRARARVGADYPHFDLGWQVDRFLTDHEGDGPRNATYVIWIGANDVRDALGALAGDPSGATSAAIVQQAVGAVIDGILVLYGANAREFLVLSVPNVGNIPAVRALAAANPVIPVIAGQLSLAFNAGLEAGLAALEAAFPDLRIIRLDTFSLLDEIVDDPGSAGFVNATGACLTFGVVGGAVCPLPNGHLFWDGAHPTAAGHGIVAEAALGVLRAD